MYFGATETIDVGALEGFLCELEDKGEDLKGLARVQSIRPRRPDGWKQHHYRRHGIRLGGRSSPPPLVTSPEKEWICRRHVGSQCNARDDEILRHPGNIKFSLVADVVRLNPERPIGDFGFTLGR